MGHLIKFAISLGLLTFLSGCVNKSNPSNTSAFSVSAQSRKIFDLPSWPGRYDLGCVSQQSCWLNGSSGLWITEDAGLTWRNTRKPEGQFKKELEQCNFVNDGTGWCWTINGFEVTSNYGRNWKKFEKTPLDFPNGSLRFVQFTAIKGEIWIAGGLYRSLRIDEKLGGVPSSIASIEKNEILETAVYRTVDEGANWEKVDFPIYWGTANQVYFIDSMPVLTIGKRAVFYTENAGKNWKTADFRISDCHTKIKDITEITCAYLISNSTGFLALQDGGFFITNDGGQTWCERITQTNNFFGGGEKYMAKMYFSDNNQGIALGGNGILYATSDAGRSWNTAYSEDRVYDFACVNDRCSFVTNKGVFSLNR